MNYEDSKMILGKINDASSILLNCHRNPDPDSFGSALALYSVLLKMGKKVRIICPTAFSGNTADFLENSGKIEHVDFSTFDFSKHDLFIALDSASWPVVTDIKDFVPPEIPVVVVDHHITSTKFGMINLVDDKATSTAEVLYLLFQDWGIKPNANEATALLAGLLADTGAFRYPGSGARTLKVALGLMEQGADKEKVVHRLFRNTEFELFKSWGELISRSTLDKNNKFYWTAVPYEKFVELGKVDSMKDSFAAVFGPAVGGTDFSIIMVETEPGGLGVSLRSTGEFDCSKIALALGGGGHKAASGCKVEGLSFDDAVEKVLETSRKIANENKS